MMTLSSLKDFNDYLLHESSAYKKSYFFRTILIPFPPPPDTALINTGYWIFYACSYKYLGY